MSGAEGGPRQQVRFQCKAGYDYTLIISKLRENAIKSYSQIFLMKATIKGG